MGNWAKTTLAAIALFGMGITVASAQPFMHVGGLTTQPVGHYDFCQRKPAECTANEAVRGPVELTRELWSQIVEINNAVNTAVTARTDMEMWGVEEYWSYPVNGYGDCEDYALEKRRLLQEVGIPEANLLMTVVRQTNGEGHAILTIQTSMGDFILDNLEARVVRWNETDYTFLKRQSQRHSGMWVGINDERELLVGSVTSSR